MSHLLARVVGGVLVGGTAAMAVASTTLIAPVAYGGFVVGAIVGGLATPAVTALVERRLSQWSAVRALSGTLGLIGGLSVAALIVVPVSRLPEPLGLWLPIALSGWLGVIGLWLGAGREWRIGFVAGQRYTTDPERPALLDTSAIIDGRIADVARAGFAGHALVIPQFVLDELRHIADSTDPMRRTRGRRGLEVLNRLRDEPELSVQVTDADFREIVEVDAKLVRLAQNMRAPIVTTDYNLNRVAELQGVRVLNVNDLANALKPVVLPGEVLDVRVVQEGKEIGQGVAFLDDGTMVVVENGKRLIGQEVTVVVSRMLQTGAGRIIFAQRQSEVTG